MPRILESDAASVVQNIGSLPEDQRPAALDILSRYKQQQDDLGEPQWPSQVNAAQDAKDRVNAMFTGGIDKVPFEVSPWSKDPALDKAMVANQAFMAHRYNIPAQQVADRPDFYRNDYARQFFGQPGGVDEKQFYGLAAKQIAGEQQSDAATLDGVKAALRGDDVIPALQAWQKTNGLDRMPDSTQFTKGFLMARQKSGDQLEFADTLLKQIESNTGLTKGDGSERPAPASQEQATQFNESLAALATMKPRDRKQVYAIIGAKAEAAGYDPKGFWGQMLSELGKGMARMGSSVTTQAGVTADVVSNFPAMLSNTMKPEEFAATDASIAKRQGIGEMYDEVANIVAGAVDPVKPVLGWMNDTVEKGLIKGPGAVAPFMMASAALGPVGATALFTTDFAEQNRRDLRAQGMDNEQAMRIGMAAAPLQAVTESLSNALQLGRFPAVQRVLSSFTKPIAGGAGLASRYLLNSGVSLATEYTEEQLQDNFIVPATQELLGALQKDVPEVDWSMYRNRAVESTPELLSVLAPMALVFGGTMTAAQVNLSSAVVSSQDMLEAVGYSAAQANSIRAVASPDAQISKAREMWGSRAGTPSSMEAAAKSVGERMKLLQTDHMAAQQDLEQRGILPRMLRAADDKWRLTFNDGSTADFNSHGEADAARWQWATDQLGKVHTSVQRTLAQMEKGADVGREFALQFSPDERHVTPEEMASQGMQDRIKQGELLDEVKPEQQFDDAAAIEKASGGGDTVHKILGSSVNTFKDGVLTTTMKLYHGANITTLVEEKLEGDAKAIMADPDGKQWMLDHLRAYEQASGDKLFAHESDKDVTPEMIAEAWSHLGQSYLVGKSADKGAWQGKSARSMFRYILNAGLSPAMNAETQYWRAVALRAQKIGELQKAGKLGDDLVSVLERQLGIDSSAKHEQGAASEAQAMGNEALSNARIYSEENPGPNGETFSVQPSPGGLTEAEFAHLSEKERESLLRKDDVDKARSIKFPQIQLVPGQKFESVSIDSDPSRSRQSDSLYFNGTLRLTQSDVDRLFPKDADGFMTDPDHLEDEGYQITDDGGVTRSFEVRVADHPPTNSARTEADVEMIVDDGRSSKSSWYDGSFGKGHPEAERSYVKAVNAIPAAVLRHFKLKQQTTAVSSGGLGPNGETFSLRITPQQDAEYMQSVQSGNVAKQQAMVDAAAKAAGYTTEGWHGSPYGPIETFDPTRSPNSYEGQELDSHGDYSSVVRGWFSTSRKVGESYLAHGYGEKVTPKTKEIPWDDSNADLPEGTELHGWWRPLDGPSKGHGWKHRALTQEEIAANKLPAEMLTPSGRLRKGSQLQVTFPSGAETGGYALEGLHNNPQAALARVREFYNAPLPAREASHLHRVWLKVENPKIEDFQGGKFKRMGARAENALREGHDAFIAKNVRDPGAAPDRVPVADTIAVFDSSQIKSADPITRDAEGNVIPLSQRFNPADDRITFSIRSGDFSSRMAAMFSPFQRSPELRLAIAKVAKDRAMRLGAEWIEKASELRSSSSIGKEAQMREALAYETRMNEYLDGLTPAARQTLEFEPSTLENDPLIHAMLDHGKLMSRSTAMQQGKLSDKAGEYDGVPWLPPAWYSKGAGIMPDQMAQAMHDAGLLPDAHADTLWQALGARIEASRKDKAAYREAAKGYKDAQKYARDASRAEADQWAEGAKKKAGSPKAQREMLKAALRTLDGILSAAPPEVRARVGGYVKLAGLATDEAMLQEIERRIEKLNVELEKWLKKEGREQIDKLLKKGRPSMDSGKKGKGKDADMHHLFAAAEKASKMDAATVAGELARLDSLIAGDTLTPEQETLATTERGLVELLGDLKHADSGRVFSAIDTLRSIYDGGWLKWKLAEIDRKERRAGARQDFITDTGKTGLKPERDAADNAAATLLGKIKGGFLSLSSFHEVLSYCFGSKSARVTSLVDAEREADGQYEDVNQALADEVEALFTNMAGGTLKGERLRFDMAQRTIKTAKGEFSQLEAIQALLMWRQEDGRRHMEGHLDESGKPVGKWHYDQAWIDEITAALTPEARRVMGWIMQKYGAEWATLNPLYRSRYGVNMPAHDNYAPITVAPMQTKAGEVVDPVTGAAMSSGSILTPGSLRTRSRNAIAEPEFLDALQTLLIHTRQLEYWKSYYDLAVEANAILGNREVLNAVKAKGGEPAATALRKWVDAIAQGGFRDAASSLEMNKLLGRMTGRAATVGLLGRVSTLLVQSTQIAAAAVKMPIGQYLVGMSKLLTGQLGYGDAIKSDFIQRRYKSAPPIVRQAMESLGAASKPNQVTRAARGLGQLLSGADALFTAGTYALLLDYHRSTGRSLGMSGADLETHAHTEAERDTEQVAQPTRMATRSLAEITMTNPLGKVTWAYASEARQKIAMAAWAATKATSEPAQFAKVMFLTFGVGGLMTQLLKNLWKEAKGDDDEKKWSPERLVMDMLSSPLHGIPVVGSLMNDGNMLSGASHLKGVDFKGDPIEIMRDVDTVLSVMGMFNDTAASTAALSHIGIDAAKVLENLSGGK